MRYGSLLISKLVCTVEAKVEVHTYLKWFDTEINLSNELKKIDGELFTSEN